MSQLKQVAANSKFFSEFKVFVKSYQQVTLMDMEKIRQRVLEARAYADGLQDVFFDVKQNYDQQILELLKKQPDHEQNFSTLPKNNRQALILLSPVTKFSGKINRKVFVNFSDFWHQNETNTDVFIMGKTGQAFFTNQFPNQPFENIETLEVTIKKLSLYQKINVFYPRFYNVVTQKPVITNLSGEKSFLQEFNTDASTYETDNKNYLFEPNLDKILNFFELQIFAILFNKTIEESDLAHLGARLTTLEATTQTLEEYTKKLQLQYQKLKRMSDNKKQRQRLAGIHLWK